MKHKLSILVVDDHKLVLDGLKRLLTDNARIESVDTATNALEGLTKLDSQYFDYVLLDISMPEMNGIEMVRELRKRKNSIPVIMITMHHDFTSAAASLHAGVNGFVLKDSGLDEIMRAIEVIELGGTYISPEVRHMLTEMNNMNKDLSVLGNPYELLSERELQIARLFAQGKTSQEIAGELFLSVTTVETHRRNIFQKLNINKTPSLVRFLYENKLI
jgi:two-component system, NarL family, nitrate/nitrite response regulator NarL